MREIWNKRIDCGKRTYFFDIKETKNGKKYLTITETRLKKKIRERDRIMIFEECIREFFKIINEIFEMFNKKL